MHLPREATRFLPKRRRVTQAKPATKLSAQRRDQTREGKHCHRDCARFVYNPRLNKRPLPLRLERDLRVWQNETLYVLPMRCTYRQEIPSPLPDRKSRAVLQGGARG